MPQTQTAPKVALITGITGQGGPCLAELVLSTRAFKERTDIVIALHGYRQTCSA